MNLFSSTVSFNSTPKVADYRAMGSNVYVPTLDKFILFQ
jgi:hypothetical protein